MQLSDLTSKTEESKWRVNFNEIKLRKMPLNDSNSCSNQSSATRKMLEKKLRSYCNIKILKKRLPICEWLPKYRLSYLQHDLVAGITVALTGIPQGMAYANLAGLPLQYGLYTSFMGLFVYGLFGSMRMVHIGPTSMMAILILDHVLVGGPAFAVWLSFLSGCVEMLLGVFRMGALVNFISLPVASGFSSAASVIVIVNLFKSILGLKFSSSSFLELVYKLLTHIPHTNYWDLILGIGCFVTLITLKKLNEKVKTFGKGQKPLPKWQRGCLSIIWFFLTARNALVVLVAAITAYILVSAGHKRLTLSADLEAGLPEFSFPSLTVEVEEKTLNFFQICRELGWGVALVPLVAILQHIAIAKSFAQGKTVDATQEIFTLGLCNVMGSFVSAFPVTASFSRTALNVSTGIKTTLAGAFTGVLVLISLGVLAPTFHYIPKATLAAVIINAVFTMIEYEMVPQLWRTKRSDLAVWIITFVGCLLFEAEYGILIGIAFSLMVLLYTTYKPSLNLQNCNLPEGEVVIIETDRALYFPSVEYTRYKVNKMTRDGTMFPVIFDGSHMCGADFTTAQGLKRLIEDFKKRNRCIIFANFKGDVLTVIKSVNPPNFIHCETSEELKIAIQASYSRILEKPSKSESDSNVDIEAGSESPAVEQQKYAKTTIHHINSESAVPLLPSSNNLADGPDSPDSVANGTVTFNV